MLNKVLALTLAGVLTLGAKIWVNAIRDPGAELGQGDWKTDIWEYPAGYGASDSARVSEHDSSRAYEGMFSFLTDTDKDPGFTITVFCNVSCYQNLKIPKAVKDLDTCSWAVYMYDKKNSYLARFFISFRSKNGKTLLWCSGNGSLEGKNDTLFSMIFVPPDSGKWSVSGGNLSAWVTHANWSEDDTISEVRLLSRGGEYPWCGQEVSWDNIYLASVAYYDYAAKSIDSDSLADKSYTPIVTFANEGIKADKDAWVYAEILEGSTRVYIDSQQVYIPKESSQQLTFKTWSVPHSGSYTLRAYPIQELDELSSDDTLEKALSGTGITEASSPSLLLDVTALSSIRYSLPLGEQGTISLYDPSGRRIESICVQGEGQVAMKSSLSSGVYFIKLEAGKAAVTKKAVVLR